MLAVAGGALAGGVLACSRPSADVTPPSAEFIVATADSTFWVRSGEGGIHVRAVPMTLARYGGRFHEVYVADLDRSFEDAVFTGERVYVRDLARGDSALVYDDTMVVRLAQHYARLHPDARPLDEDDDTPTNPAITATGETDLLEVRGPYVLLEHRSTFAHAGDEQDDTVQAAVDLRTGAGASLAALRRDPAVVHDSSVVRSVPTTWTRRGYTLLARGDSTDGSVSLTLRDGASRSWPLFSTSPHPRIYWLDVPPVDAATRRALARAFNDAAAYDESVKYVRATPRERLPHDGRTLGAATVRAVSTHAVAARAAHGRHSHRAPSATRSS
jgi:hypothetical protein